MTEEQRPGRSAAAVFDALGAAYEQAFAGSQAHRRSLERLLGRLARGSSVLDAGSGTGRPTAQTLPLDVEGVHGVFMGQPVRVASFDAEALTAVAEDAGFEVVAREETLFTPAHPDAAPEPHLFLPARRR